MKNVLLLVHEDSGQEARLQAALDLTRALDGHLTCVNVTPVQFPLPADLYGAGSGVLLLTEERQRSEINRERMIARLEHEDVAWDWREITGDFADSMIAASDLADLIVVNRRLDEYPYPDMRGIASSILVRSRTPLVAVPDRCAGFNAAGRALIAWNGSAEVSATMQAAIPLLKLASSVQLFEVDDGLLTVPAREAGAYLSRHGIHPTIRRINPAGSPAHEVIMDGCAVLRASYCLMGAFGRSPLSEAVFGGVTRRMLSHSPIPLVLGH